MSRFQQILLPKMSFFVRQKNANFVKNLNFQNKGFLLIFAIFGCSAHSKNKLLQNGWRLTDSLRTGTAIGFHASRKHYLKILIKENLFSVTPYPLAISSIMSAVV